MVENPMRSVTHRITREIHHRRDHDETPAPGAVTDVDDDPDAEPLPPLIPADAVDDEMKTLDEDEAPPVGIGDDVGLADLFGELDPVPHLPLSGPHEISLLDVVLRLARQGDAGLLQDRRVRRVLDLLGDRLSVTVSQDGITVRGVVRTRHTPWKHVQALTFTSRYDLLRGNLVTKLAEDIARRLFPLPIPGLAWLLRRLVGGITAVYERRTFTAEELEELRTGLGHALTDIRRRGLDIELTGALRVLMFFSLGLSTAIGSEAADRGIEVAGVAA